MHMADALISPAVGGVMWAVSAGTIVYCSRQVRHELDDSIIPLMGVLGAFIFAAQMVNFTIPVTGSSGHLGGGLILAAMLGPYASFLVIASILTVQAFFFADGGLLALGCNIFNLGFFPAFIAYPLVFKKLAGFQPAQTKMTFAAIVAAVIGLQMGAFAVVLETVASGISSLPFSTFVTIMQPIHLAIGVVEGVVTASVLAFVSKTRPEILTRLSRNVSAAYPMRGVVLTFLAAAIITGGVVSWFASERPDGLEWSIEKITGNKDVKTVKTGTHETLAAFQKTTAVLPDYSFNRAEPAPAAEQLVTAVPIENSSKLGTSVSGIVGGGVTLATIAVLGLALRRREQAA